MQSTTINSLKSTQLSSARKRPVNLTLSEDLVNQAKELTNNLSAVVEQLLAEYVVKQNSARQEKNTPRRNCCTGLE